MEHEALRFWMKKLDAGLITSLPASDPGSAAVWSSNRINPRRQSCLCLTWSGSPSNDEDEWLNGFQKYEEGVHLSQCIKTKGTHNAVETTEE